MFMGSMRASQGIPKRGGSQPDHVEILPFKDEMNPKSA